MPIYDTFSRRKKRAEKSGPDVYQYETIPSPLRHQIRHIWDSALGPFRAPMGMSSGSAPRNNEAWDFIRNAMIREKGLPSLSGHKNPYDDCVGYLYGQEDIVAVLDLIEFSFRYVNGAIPRDEYDRKQLGISQDPQEAITELNFRFREAG